MGKIAQIKVGEHRGIHSIDLNDVECGRDDEVIVEMDRGMEFGTVVSDMNAVCAGKAEAAEGKVIRRITDGDRNQIQNNRLKAQDAISTCARKVDERRLNMRLVKAEYLFDCSKVIFFFTAEGRVDFRVLVKDLAKIFRVRIELKQIGVRDKAKIVGGYGVCGRELCCSSYLKDFHPLSIKMAKEQSLPLNPSRISGVCGRIKCCMAYEFSIYREMARSLPRVGDKVDTPEGKGRVKDINILKKTLLVDLGEGKVTKLVVSSKDV
jgi:cell fate regulator YaaT (PSP1 superfamily)